jgi:hypothetical protein
MARKSKRAALVLTPEQTTTRAFILVGSRADSESCVVGSEAGVPPFEVLAKPIIDDADAHLEHQVRTLRRPAHLL